MKLFVFRHCVVVAGSGAGDEFDFVTHGSILRWLNFLTGGSQVGDDLLDTVLVNILEACVRNTQPYETILGFEPKALALEVRQKATTRFIVCVRNVIARLRPFPRHLAYSGHG
jgi:hypothetical protein